MLMLLNLKFCFILTEPVFGSVELTGGTSGRLLVTLYNGTTGTVCDDNWSDANCQVVCSMLGYW